MSGQLHRSGKRSLRRIANLTEMMLVLLTTACLTIATQETPAETLPPTRTAPAESVEATTVVPAASTPTAVSDRGTSTPTVASTELDIPATGTAAAFDAEATVYAATEAAQPAFQAAAALVTREFVVYDEAGLALGDGQVRVFAPREVSFGQSAEVRVEIVVSAAVPPDGTYNPPMSPTPAFGTPQPTPSPLPLVESQFVAVREYMGAELRGADLANFYVDAVPPGGLRRIRPEAINWWKWTLEPVGPEAVGVNRLEIVIFLPRTRSDGTRFDEETNTIPFTLEVVGGNVGPTQLGWLWVVAGAVIALGGASGAFYGAWRMARIRRGMPAPTLQEGQGQDGISLSVSGDVGGQVTIAGDDVITYQTIIQKMPTTLVVVLIAGLTALVIGLAVIVVVIISGMP